VKSAELVRDFLGTVNATPAENEKGRVGVFDPKTIPMVLEALRKGGADAYGTLQRVAVQKRALDKQIAALERDLARIKGSARDSRTLAISVAASSAGSVRASYQVPNAGWRPAYRASLDSAGSRVELERTATVTQRTGEDWSGVSLKLATGQPRAATIVDPATWQLVILSPQTLYLSAPGVPDFESGLRSRTLKCSARGRRPSGWCRCTSRRSRSAAALRCRGRAGSSPSAFPEILALDPQLARERHLRACPSRASADGWARSTALRLAFGVVVDHELQRIEHRHAARRDVVQVLAHAVLEHAELDPLVALDTPMRSANRRKPPACSRGGARRRASACAGRPSRRRGLPRRAGSACACSTARRR
jgi:hypothetical protein